MENPFDTILMKLSSIELTLSAMQEATQTPSILSMNAYPPTGGIDLAVLITGLKKSTIYKLVMRDKICYSKPAGKLVFVTADLMQWISEKSNKQYIKK
jgi:predicted DNA-binding transcriptional regulator AlpA